MKEHATIAVAIMKVRSIIIVNETKEWISKEESCHYLRLDLFGEERSFIALRF